MSGNCGGFKEYNISRHFTTKHANYASKLSTKEREATAQKLAANLQAQQNFFHRQTAIQESSTKASFMLSFKLAKASKPLFEALDESNDVKDTAQLLIFIRGINDTFEITDEFLTMESLKGQTRGEDLYDRVSAVIEKMKLPWSKLINVTTDGSPNLTGKNLNHVVNPVVKLVNFIRARGLQHRQFITFLEETDADHQDLLYHSRVRWLSLGKEFQRVWELKEKIGAFLELQGKADEFPELSNKSWLCDFAFAADVFSHMNELNMKLQGKDQFVQDMYTNVKAFKSKLVLFSRQILNKPLTHFPTLATLKEAGAKMKKYSESLDALHGEFCHRFSDFEKIDKSLQLVACPRPQNSSRGAAVRTD
ncbi:general transcription factor II-I repeat domain-containing protein 2-like [Watersipora subatra]|uniref:general transcription factor II-I repeat domain-containing protein 2-like n=1 Tax=Watersipora subatra TaxID=2589382 RepID=UPI00355C8485